MKFGLRIFSLNKRISARLSIKRIIRHNMRLKVPNGLGIVTDPHRSIYNRIYTRTSFGFFKFLNFFKKWTALCTTQN